MSIFNTKPGVPVTGTGVNTVPTAAVAAPVKEASLEQEFYSALTKNTYIEGNITTKDEMTYSGGLKGNIASSHVLHLDGGIVEGAVNVNTLDIENGKIKGPVIGKGDVYVDSLSVIIGDVRAHDLVSDGKIKGDLYIEGTAVVSASAVIFGNIKAAEINIDPGAMVKGTIEVVRQSMVSSKMFEFEEEFMDLTDFAASVE